MDKLEEILMTGKPLNLSYIVTEEQWNTIIEGINQVKSLKKQVADLTNIIETKPETITVNELARMLHTTQATINNYIKSGILKNSIIKDYGRIIFNKKIALEELKSLQKNQYNITDISDIKDKPNNYLSFEKAATYFNINNRTLRKAIDKENFIADCIVISGKHRKIDIEKAKERLKNFYQYRLQRKAV